MPPTQTAENNQGHHTVTIADIGIRAPSSGTCWDLREMRQITVLAKASHRNVCGETA